MAPAIVGAYAHSNAEENQMDWQIIASLIVSAGAIVAYFAMAETPQPKQRSDRTIQGNYAWKPPTPQVDAEVIDRFVKAIEAQSRPSP